MSNPDFISLRMAIKEAMKLQKVRYSTMAKKLNLSESGFKKIMTGADCSFNKLLAICKILDLELKDLIDNSKYMESPNKVFTKKQKIFLGENIAHFFFYMSLKTPPNTVKTLVKRHRLTVRSLNRYLKDLEDLGLVQRKGNKVELFHGDLLALNKKIGDQMMKSFHDNFFRDLLNDKVTFKANESDLGLGIVRMTKNTFKEYAKARKDLAREFDKKLQREHKVAKSADLVDVALVSYLVPYPEERAYPIPNFK